MNGRELKDSIAQLWKYWARLALDTGEFKRFYYAFFLKGLGSHSYRGWPVDVI